MKSCTLCFKSKQLDDFHKSSIGIEGRKPRCKDCTSTIEKEKRINGTSGDAARCKRYREKNPDTRSMSVAKYNKSEKKKLSHKKWALKNIGIIKKNCLNYRETLASATIVGKKYGILAPYRKLARDISAQTGIKYSVDHLIPIRGENVCGLNVTWNIQIIPLSENIKKSNKVSA